MKPETLEALKGSIEKWRKIVEDDGVDCGTDNCPLCALFWSPVECANGCPIKAATGAHFCDGTPYQEWHDECTEYPNGTNGFPADTPKKKAIAVRMLDFLRSLLPKEEEQP